METKKFIYYQAEDMFVGWFERKCSALLIKNPGAAGYL